jgi:glucose-6-phosphate 1-epimerase
LDPLQTDKSQPAHSFCNNAPKSFSSPTACAKVYLRHIARGFRRRICISRQRVRDGAVRGSACGVSAVLTLGPLPKHGFARNQAWELISVGDGSARFQLRDSEATRAIWPQAFLAEFTVTVRERQLIMALAITNRGEQPFNFTAALHTYLRVDDIVRHASKTWAA